MSDGCGEQVDNALMADGDDAETVDVNDTMTDSHTAALRDAASQQTAYLQHTRARHHHNAIPTPHYTLIIMQHGRPLFMVALWNRETIYIFMLWFVLLSSFFVFLFFFLA